MYKLCVKSKFSAAHKLLNYPGACGGIHGHNWTIEVTVGSETLDENGMVIDLLELKKHIDECVSQFDHRLINEVAPFDKLNPTSENIARHLYDYISKKITLQVLEVKVAEVDDYSVIYSPE